MFVRTVFALIALIGCGVALSAQDTPRIWQGVYTSGQAERGKAAFNNACIRCHGEDLAGTTAPALKGERFESSWGGGTIENLFVKIRDTMPPNFGTILDDQAKLDIVSYILQTNGFPAGSSELQRVVPTWERRRFSRRANKPGCRASRWFRPSAAWRRDPTTRGSSRVRRSHSPLAKTCRRTGHLRRPRHDRSGRKRFDW